MGTCISKCCLNSNPPPNSSSDFFAKENSDSNSNLPPPQDKLVISQSPLPTSSSSSSASTSASLSSFSSTSTSTTCSSSSTTSKLKPYTNDFLLSCAKENPHIIILDPHKYDMAPKPKKPTLRPNNQCNSVKLPSKRERPNSPQRPIVRQKSFRSEVRPGINTKPSRTSSSPNNVAKSWSRNVERNEKPRPLSPCNSLSRIKFKERIKDRPRMVEDIDNPLISMECFIFL